MSSPNPIGALLLMLAWDAAAALGPPPGKPPARNYLMAEYGGHLNNCVVRQAPDLRIVVGSGDGLVIFDGAAWQSVPSRHRNRIRVMEIDVPRGRRRVAARTWLAPAGGSATAFPI